MLDLKSHQIQHSALFWFAADFSIENSYLCSKNNQRSKNSYNPNYKNKQEGFKGQFFHWVIEI